MFFSGSRSSFFVVVGGWKGEGGTVELSSKDTLTIVVFVVAWVSLKVLDREKNRFLLLSFSTNSTVVDR